MARVIQVIETIETRGKGEESDPLRCVRRYYTFDGEMLAENDPVDPFMAERTRLRETLFWLNNKGGLGHDVHERINAALTNGERPNG